MLKAAVLTQSLGWKGSSSWECRLSLQLLFFIQVGGVHTRLSDCLSCFGMGCHCTGGSDTPLMFGHDPSAKILMIRKPGVNIAQDFTLTIS